jgi:hypothetical protein
MTVWRRPFILCLRIKSRKSKNLIPKATENHFFEKKSYTSFRGEGLIFEIRKFCNLIFPPFSPQWHDVPDVIMSLQYFDI